MYSYTFRQWLSFFYLYCIFGWCFESAYVSLKQLRPVNRGFLKGPWLPLYGSGAVLVLLITMPFDQHPVAVYIAGLIGATLLELVTGEAMVRLFKVRYWDYSNQHFQYKGHICLSSSIVWGFFSVMMVYVVQPQVERFVFWLNSEFVSVMTFLITVCMVYDFAGAFRKAMDLRNLLDQAEQILQELEQRAAEKKRLLEATATFAKATVTENIAEKKEALTQKVQSLDLESVRLEELQQQLKNRMAENAEWFLTHNPGSRFMTARGETVSAEIRDLIKKLRLDRLKEKRNRQ